MQLWAKQVEVRNKHMEINHLKLPVILEESLTRQLFPLTTVQTNRLATLLTATETALPKLFDLEGIRDANHFWSSPHVEHYIGADSEIYKPGKIDPNKTIIVGQAEPDSPIALDYRVCPPRVVYFGDEGYWIELAPNYDSLIVAITAN